MTSAAIVQKLWNYCNVLRDDGMSYGDYVEQLTYLLFLKMADERTKPPHNQPSGVPAKYNPVVVPQKRDCGMSFYERSLWLHIDVLHWPTLLKKDGDDLFDHYRHMLESLGKDSALSNIPWPLPYSYSN
jgi:type I restriction enzyme M protein